MTAAAPACVGSAFDVATMVSNPGAIAVTVPVLSTFAMLLFLDDQITVQANPESAFTDAPNWSLSPTFIVAFCGVTFTPCTPGTAQSQW